jgi:peptide/nickel transport system permease protein
MRANSLAGILRAIVKRLAIALGTLIGASALVFLGMQAIPGNAAEAVLGADGQNPAAIAALRVKFGLNRPGIERYGSWLWGLLHGSLGTSWSSGEPVWQQIGGDVGNTAILAAITFVLLVPISVSLGVFSAVRRGGVIDNAITSTAVTLIAVPEFVFGTFLVAVFAVGAGILPAVTLIRPGESLFSSPQSLVLPVITLLAGSSAGSIRMVRACMIDVLSSDYIEMVRLKGVSERRLILRHALPNALGSTIQVLALTAAVLAGGVVVVETLFQFPGMGNELVGSVSARDVPTVEAIVMVITAFYVVVNLLANLAVTLLNPRLRRAGM